MLLVFLWSSHFWYKVGYNGMGATQHFFASLGLPTWLAWIDVTIEPIGVVMLLLGIWVPLVCVAMLPILLSAIVIYLPEGYWFAGGGIEFPALWVAIQLISALLGPGRWSVDRAQNTRLGT